eukprot:CAMPEP_0180645662 /NCGR_PEP_ID=MMETSP1037_2-20121125/49124_1 /TAXON_ID=632150 /ORGANISM="Azadinium spinosum, Strain 3D9" /LENGTH=103 /DNA_ID=CAMNT_0022669565 /DNA_START=77 /DNA_END=386 /DNA_ORIENTATION=+
MALSCGRCGHKVDVNEGVQLFLRRHLPDASWSAKESLTTFTWGLKKQVGIYDVGRTSPPSRQVREVLNGSGVIARDVALLSGVQRPNSRWSTVWWAETEPATA